MSKPTVTEKQIRNRTDAKSFSRGKDYFRGRAIHTTVRRGNDIEARCDGSDYQPYRVRATLSDTGIVSASCTCPYDWGGDCKHIVALLLTYLNTPEVFDERDTIQKQLAKRSKEDLIALIEDMIERYPSLRDMVDTPTPAQVTIGQPVDTTMFRKQLQQARYSYDYNDPTPYRVVTSITKTAERFAEQEDWENALRIYGALVEEATPYGDYFIPDDEGDFLMLISEVLESIVAILEKPGLADDDTLRQMGLDALIRAEIWDIQAGGVSLTDGVYDETVGLIRREDVPPIRRKIELAKAKKAQQAYGKWGVEAYERFLMVLDSIEEVDAEVALERLRDSDIPALIVTKLLELNRHEEALSILDNQITYHGDLLRVLPHMVEVGLGDAVVERVEAKVKAEYNDWLVNWLIRYYSDTDKRDDLFRWLRTRFEKIMDVKSYNELKVVAQEFGKWQALQPELIQHIKREKRFDALIRIYMHEEEWQQAWDTLPQLLDVPSKFRYGSHYIEVELAKKSQKHFPKQAIAVFSKQAQLKIGGRQRSAYAEAATYLAMVKDLYRDIDDMAAWQKLIREIREEYKRLPALQDELNKARLDK